MKLNHKFLAMILACADSAFDGRFGYFIRDTVSYESRFGYDGISVPALHSMACVLKHTLNIDSPYSFRGCLTKKSAFSGIKDDSKLVVFPHSPQLEDELELLSPRLVRKIRSNLDDAIVQVDKLQVTSDVDAWEKDIGLTYGRLREEMTLAAGYSTEFFRDMNATMKLLSGEEKNKAYEEWEKKRVEYLDKSVEEFLKRANESRLKEYHQFKAA